MNKQDLIDFETKIADLYEGGNIAAPVHLRDGNEDSLIEIFKSIEDEDYVFGTWASHLHALLKGVPPAKVESDILAGRSITLHYPEYNFYTSAIVGGIAPIAVGAAAGLKMRKSDCRVYCFLGDMSFHTGIAHESIKYAVGHNLPITFIMEDNNKSVCTETDKTWGMSGFDLYRQYIGAVGDLRPTEYHSVYREGGVGFIYYSFESSYPHSGTGTFVQF